MPPWVIEEKLLLELGFGIRQYDNNFIRMDSSRLSTGQLNSSSSKMKYSFPRNERFDYKRYEYVLLLS